MALRKQNLPAPEELLRDYVKRMKRHREGRVALCVHLSRLQRENQRPEFFNMVRRELGILSRAYHGEVFVLGNEDTICIVKDVPPNELENLQFKIRFTFTEDPLVKAEDAGEDVCFIRKYNIKWDFDELLALSQDYLQALRDAKYERFKQKVPELKEVEEEPEPEPVQELAPSRDGQIIILDRELPCNDVFQVQSVAKVSSTRGLDVISDRIGIQEFWPTEQFLKDQEEAASPKLRNWLRNTAQKRLPNILNSLCGEHDNSSAPYDIVVETSLEALQSAEYLNFLRHRRERFRHILFLLPVRQAMTMMAQFSYLKEFLADHGQSCGIYGCPISKFGEIESRLMPVDHYGFSLTGQAADLPPPTEVGALLNWLREREPWAVSLSGVNATQDIEAAVKLGFRTLSGRAFSGH